MVHALNMSLNSRHHNLDLDSEVRYVALSYCWGDENDIREIRIGDSKLQITRSLWIALEQIRSYDHDLERDTSVWIDQICIDQENTTERSQQVQRMWQIYSSAIHVYAWLGHYEWRGPDDWLEDDVNLSGTVEYMSTWDPCSARVDYRSQAGIVQEVIAPIPRPGGHGMLARALSRSSGWSFPDGSRIVDKDLVTDVMELLDRPYFSRTWIIPEILQARKLTFLYGVDHCPAQELHAPLDRMIRAGWKYATPKFVKIKHLLDQIDQAGASSRTKTHRSAFIEALESLHETDCSDIRDRIFAVSSIPSLIVSDWIAPPRPDYLLSREELVVVVVESMINYRGPGRVSQNCREQYLGRWISVPV